MLKKIVILSAFSGSICCASDSSEDMTANMQDMTANMQNVNPNIPVRTVGDTSFVLPTGFQSMDNQEPSNIGFYEKYNVITQQKDLIPFFYPSSYTDSLRAKRKLKF